MAETKISTTDAEVAVLSIVLRNPDLAHELEGFKSYMFSSIPNQNLFREIEERLEKQSPIDAGLIVADLESRGEIAKIGGKKQIDFFINQNINEDTLQKYKEIVANSWKTRTVISMGNGLNIENVNAGNVNQVILDTKKGLDELSLLNGDSKTVSIGDIINDVYEEIKSRSEHPGIKGSTWGIKELDSATGGKCPGDLWIIGGRPGQGKTALVCNSILADAEAGVPSLIFSKEMRNQEISERLISLKSGVPITNIRLGVLDQKQVNKIFETISLLHKLPIYIDSSFRNSDLSYMESTVVKYKRQFGVQVAYLDYIQIAVDRDDNQTQEIGRVSRLFKGLSNELGICSVLVSQLNRAVELRENKRPILSDLRQSGNLEEDADMVVGLYRDEYYNKETKYKNLMEFNILKYRNGAIGSMTLKFDPITNLITGT